LWLAIWWPEGPGFETRSHIVGFMEYETITEFLYSVPIFFFPPLWTELTSYSLCSETWAVPASWNKHLNSYYFLSRRQWSVVQNIKSCFRFTGMYQCTMASFLGAFTKLRKPTISFTMSLCLPARPSVLLSVRMQQLGSQWTDFYEIWYLRICRKNLSINFKFDYNLTRITAVLHLWSHWIYLRIRNVSAKSCREN